jgi:hypothetical protein
MSSNRSRSRSRSKSRSKPKTPEKNECSICYTPIENESDKKTCKICKSKFHKECLDHWCNMPNNAVCPCPICRQTIQTRKNTLPIKELIKYWKEFNNDQVDPEELDEDDIVDPDDPNQQGEEFQEQPCDEAEYGTIALSSGFITTYPPRVSAGAAYFEEAKTTLVEVLFPDLPT